MGDEPGHGDVEEREAGVRRWPWLVGLVVAFVAGAMIVGAAMSSTVSDRDDELRDVRLALRETKADLGAVSDRLNDREAQRKADEAAARAEEAAAALDQRRAEEAAAAKAEADLLAAQERARIPGDGTYAIGVDKDPGRYKTTGEPSSCYFQLTTVPGANPGDPGWVNNEIGSGTRYVDLAAGQFFTSARCGSWDRVG